MASYHGLLNRDLVGNTLSIRGREVIDKDRNINAKDIEACNVHVKCDLTVDGKLVPPNLHSNPMKQSDLNRRATYADSPANLYDIIVCGAGTAGSLLVYRLAERYPNANILVLDMGKDDVRDTTSTPNPNDPSDDWGQLLRGSTSIFGEGGHVYHSEIKTRQGDEKFRTAIHDPMSGTLGGNSANNASIWNRGTKKGAYDRWEAAVGSEFGWSAMNASYKTIENRSQSTRVFGSPPIPYWYPVAGPTPAQTFNPLYHGNTGKMYLSQNFLPSIYSVAVNEAVTDSPLPNRTGVFSTYLDPDDPNNPEEYTHLLPITMYDQSDPAFPTFNPYPPTTPGYTYTPPADPGNAKGPEYAGFPNVILAANPAFSSKFLQARCYAAPAYLYPIIDNVIPHNVTIKTSAFITKLLFENPNDPAECTGVEWVEDGWHVMNLARSINRSAPQYAGTISDVDKSLYSAAQAVINQANATVYKAYAKSDVWLCMGAKNTPKLLQLSGIGPRKHLESLRLSSPVPLRVDLPGVGAATQDTLDMGIGWLQEADTSTGLPAPLPAAVLSAYYGSSMGIADPTDPFDPFNTYSIGGVAQIAEMPINIKTNPSKPYHDMTILTAFGDAVSSLGSLLWKDTLDAFEGNKTDINLNESHPGWDRYRWGFNDPRKTSLVHTTGFLCEYWDMASQGEVKIKSGNPFDPATYAPAMGANEADIEAMVNAFRDTVLPICKRLATKKYGQRGLGTYVGTATAGGANTIDLSAALIPYKSFDSSELITQGTYDSAGSLDPVGPTAVWVVSIVAGTGAGQNNAIVSWPGSGGGYQATMLIPWAVVPDATSVYFLNPPNATPVDVVKFSGDNFRNFARMVRPNGDNFLSAYHVETLVDPLTTLAGSTRIAVNQVSHGLTEGDFIRMQVQSDVDNIDAVHFNEFHVVDNVVDGDNYEIVLFWNPSPVDGPGSLPIANPAAAAVGVVGTGGPVYIEKHTFNEKLFRQWLERTYFSGWHACCSCRMGLPTDSMAVVDTRARVYNTKGLRIADCSIFPVKPDCNTQAPAYGITQRLFELISVEEYDNYFN